jgi:hypothetical protein
MITNVKFNRPADHYEMVEALHDITTNQHNAKWNKLDFTLFPQGRFDLNFIWDQE